MTEQRPQPAYLPWPDEDNPEWVLVFWFQRLGDRTELVGFEMKSVRTHFPEGEAIWRDREFFDPDAHAPDEDVAPIHPKPLGSATLREAAKTGLAQEALGRWRATDAHLDDAVAAGRLKKNLYAMHRDVMGTEDESEPVRRWTAKDFELVARLYRQALAEPGPKRTNVLVAQWLSEHKGQEVTRKTAERLIYRARHEFHTIGEDE